MSQWLGETLTGTLSLYYNVSSPHSLTCCITLIDGFHPWNSSHCRFHKAHHYSLSAFWLKELLRDHIALNQWFSTQSNPASQGAFGNIWRHFLVSQQWKEGSFGIQWVEANGHCSVSTVFTTFAKSTYNLHCFLLSVFPKWNSLQKN